jgi:hypothetical protein
VAKRGIKAVAKAGASAGNRWYAPLVLATGLALSVPTAGLALGGVAEPAADAARSFSAQISQFTPASVDPQLARRVADAIAAHGQTLRFTPAGTATAKGRTVTVAVRVDDQTARAISVRSAIAAAQGEPGIAAVSVAPMRYNLGIARGYGSFVKPLALPVEVRKIDMPDLAAFKPHEAARGAPGRLQPRIAFEQDGPAGRAPRTLDSQGEQRVDFGGAYRLSRNFNVTAGVRLSQERDRLAPLTTAVQDSQAVYVGTQLRF